MFTTSKCPHCKGSSFGSNFELARTEPQGSRVAMYFIQCASCKAPVGVTEFYDSASLAKEQEKRLKAIENQVRNIDYNIQNIIHALNHRMRA